MMQQGRASARLMATLRSGALSGLWALALVALLVSACTPAPTPTVTLPPQPPTSTPLILTPTTAGAATATSAPTSTPSSGTSTRAPTQAATSTPVPPTATTAATTAPTSGPTGQLTPPPASEVQPLVSQGGCGACHTIPGISGANGTIGPSWCVPAKDYQDGTKTLTDIINCIKDPNPCAPPGYPINVMPQNFGSTFTQQQLTILASYIATLSCP